MTQYINTPINTEYYPNILAHMGFIPHYNEQGAVIYSWVYGRGFLHSVIQTAEQIESLQNLSATEALEKALEIIGTRRY